MARSKPPVATQPPAECWAPLPPRPLRMRALACLADGPVTVRRLGHTLGVPDQDIKAMCASLVRSGQAVPLRPVDGEGVSLLTCLTITLDGERYLAGIDSTDSVSDPEPRKPLPQRDGRWSDNPPEAL